MGRVPLGLGDDLEAITLPAIELDDTADVWGLDDGDLGRARRPERRDAELVMPAGAAGPAGRRSLCRTPPRQLHQRPRRPPGETRGAASQTPLDAILCLDKPLRPRRGLSWADAGHVASVGILVLLDEFGDIQCSEV